MTLKPAGDLFSRDPSENTPNASEESLSVAQLVRGVKSTLESRFGAIVVEGEITNYHHHGSGHRYFTLKDAEAQVRCAMWKSRLLAFVPKDGMKVVVRGRMTVYPARGELQLDVQQMRPAGEGDLQAAFEALRLKLEAEGLFDVGRKREIPEYPETIGIVTSETGAALQDILAVLRRRYPLARVLLRPTAVQGIGAELEIARAIREFSALATRRGSRQKGTAQPVPDVLIVGRGGGSLEDLWCFNEEAVARAIYASKIPVISAVGHEVDNTIADLVADLRAATPTAAAEIATPDISELARELGAIQQSLTTRVHAMIGQWEQQITMHSGARSLRSLLLQTTGRRTQELTGLMRQLSSSVSHELERKQLAIGQATARLEAMDPDRVLQRGFTVLELAGSGEVVSRLDQLKRSGERGGTLVFTDGRVGVRFDL